MTECIGAQRVGDLILGTAAALIIKGGSGTSRARIPRKGGRQFLKGTALQIGDNDGFPHSTMVGSEMLCAFRDTFLTFTITPNIEAMKPFLEESQRRSSQGL